MTAVAPAQARLLFLESLVPDTAVHNIAWSARIRGPFDADAFRRALQEIVNRHAALRTAFVRGEGGLRAAVGDGVEVHVERGGPGSFEEGVTRAAELARTPIETGRPPLLRARVDRIGASDHLVTLCVHHLVFDGGSLGIVLRELSAALGGSDPDPDPAGTDPSGGTPAAGEPVEDVAPEPADPRAEAFWREQFPEAPPVLDLPTDRARPAVQRPVGAIIGRALPPSLTRAVEILAAAERVTPFVISLAAFQLVLARASGQEAFAVGCPVDARTSAGLQGRVGLLVDTVALRSEVRGDRTVREVLRAVRGDVLGALSWRGWGFDRLVAALGVPRALDRHPVFQVMFSLQEAGGVELRVPGAEVDEVPRDRIHTGTCKTDLNLVVERRGPGRWTAWLEYNTDLFDRATADRLLDRYEQALGEMARGPEQGISELGGLTDGDRQQVLHAWSGAAARPVAGERSPIEAFDARVAEHPGAPAVSEEGGGTVTYAELSREADAVAARLAEEGVARGEVVAILADRSIRLVAGVLGVHRAGGAYLPLDPTHPEARRSGMLEDAGVRLVLTDPAHAVLPDEVVPVALGPEPGSGPGRASSGVPGVRRSPEDLAYVVFTSGSTGRPKGVEVADRGLANLAAWHGAAYGLGPSVRTTLLASPAFDASVWELWGALASGAELCVPAASTVGDPPSLRDWLAGERIAVSFLPTPLAEAIMEEGMPPDAPLRWLLTGGDRLRRRPPERAPYRLVNHYGPSENTVVVSAGPVEPGDAGMGLPGIGRPLPGVLAFVLDPRGRPVPPGTPGELCCGGVGLARGYRGRAEETALRFVEVDLPDHGPTRLYRTGDRVRHRADGSLEFLGRLDAQVKVNGHRIEPGEVEARLVEHPDVREAVVGVTEPGPGQGARLVAWVVTEPGAQLVASDLRRSLRDALPRFMIPAHFVEIAELPIGPTGKVDRARLPAPEVGHGARAAVVPPRSAIERTVAEVWMVALRRETVSVHDNFFELGGDSLAAHRTALELEGRTGAPVNPRALFFHTLEQLAAEIGRAGRAEDVGNDS